MPTKSSITPDDPFEVFSVEQLRLRSSVKWNVPEGALPLFIAEMDVDLAEPVQRAVRDMAAAGDFGYATGPHRYAEAYRDFARDRWGVDVDVSAARGNGGVMPAIVELLRIVTDPGSTVIVMPPVYAPFYSFIRYAERSIADAPLGPDGRFDLEAIESALAAASGTGTRTAIVIANPQNPTGVACTRTELEQLAALAERWDATVISDEIHSPLGYEQAHVPYVSVDPRGFTVFSASKAFNLAGLPASLMLGGADAATELARIDPTFNKTLGLVAAGAHVAALTEGRPWLDATTAALAARREHLGALVRDRLPGVGFRAPEATYLAWLDFSSTALADPAATPAPGAMGTDLGIAGTLAERCGVYLSSGEAFGEGGQNRVRLNFGTRFDVLDEAVDRIAALL